MFTRTSSPRDGCSPLQYFPWISQALLFSIYEQHSLGKVVRENRIDSDTGLVGWIMMLLANKELLLQITAIEEPGII